MFRRTVAAFATVVVAASALTGVASAAKPVVKAPTGKTKVTTVSGLPTATARLVGTPWDGEPGDANKAECQAIADIAQAIHDGGGPKAQAAEDATLDFGLARGCVFTGGF